MLNNQQIAELLHIPEERIAAYWPLIDACLAALCTDGDGYTDLVQIAALATVRVECPPFQPIREYGSDELHEKEYGGRKDLGNVHAGDGAKYEGRGFIQITGEFNYAHYGQLLGVDLIVDPDKALEPNIAATIFAAYFHSRGCDKAANANEWVKVRTLVNGGHNGLDVFLFLVEKLARAAGYEVMSYQAAGEKRLVVSRPEAKKAAAAQ